VPTNYVVSTHITELKHTQWVSCVLACRHKVFHFHSNAVVRRWEKREENTLSAADSQYKFTAPLSRHASKWAFLLRSMMKTHAKKERPAYVNSQEWTVFNIFSHDRAFSISRASCKSWPREREVVLSKNYNGHANRESAAVIIMYYYIIPICVCCAGRLATFALTHTWACMWIGKILNLICNKHTLKLNLV
jgi:hypothetical protein